MYCERLTVGKLKQLLEQYHVPDEAVVCCQSDEEGNRTMVCMEMFIDRVGRKEKFDETYTYVAGEDVIGIDLEADKNKTFVTFQPMY